MQSGLSFCLILFKVEHWASMVLGLNTAPSITMATGEKTRKPGREAASPLGWQFTCSRALRLPAVWESGAAEVQSEPAPILAVKWKGGQ